MSQENMNWEEIEHAKSGQLHLPGFASFPTVAERAFLEIARKWQDEINSRGDERISRSDDIRALSCLILSVEWGRNFTPVARKQIEENQQIMGQRDFGNWYDRLPWELCSVADYNSPSQSDEVNKLVANLDHHNSGIRNWMFEIGWCVKSWLPVELSVKKLLKNFADTLGGPFKAAGLAAALFDSPEEYFHFAHDFTPSDEFIDQYHDRLKHIEEMGQKYGILYCQMELLNMECQCRKIIELSSLNLKLKATDNAT